ncbi:hypothetical protein ACTXT7_008332 [Hymenolepis weldensis]
MAVHLRSIIATYTILGKKCYIKLPKLKELITKKILSKVKTEIWWKLFEKSDTLTAWAFIRQKPKRIGLKNEDNVAAISKMVDTNY